MHLWPSADCVTMLYHCFYSMLCDFNAADALMSSYWLASITRCSVFEAGCQELRGNVPSCILIRCWH
jgi:hypothetical protein